MLLRQSSLAAARLAVGRGSSRLRDVFVSQREIIFSRDLAIRNDRGVTTFAPRFGPSAKPRNSRGEAPWPPPVECGYSAAPGPGILRRGGWKRRDPISTPMPVRRVARRVLRRRVACIQTEGDVAALMRGAPNDVLRISPVDKKVGNVRNDGPELIEPVVPAEALLL